MGVFRNLNISRKFGFSFGAVCILCAILGLSSVFGFIHVNASLDDLVNNTLPSTRLLGAIQFEIATIRRADALLQLCDTAECAQHYLERRRTNIASYRDAIQNYQPLISYPGEKELAESIRQNADAYIQVSDRVSAMIGGGAKTDASHLLISPEAQQPYDAAAKAVEDDIDLNSRFGTDGGNRSILIGHRLLAMAITLMIVTFLLCVGIGSLLTRAIVPPLKKAAAALDRFAHKDLTVSIHASSQDEVGQLSHALNTAVESMQIVLQTLARSAETLAAAAEQMSQHAVGTRETTREQSSKTNQIAAAAQEMSATIAEISQNAERASGASRTSAETAAQGGVVMESTANTMQRISSATGTVTEKMDSLARSSNEIGKVIGVIQEISEQTNLLALNASIEAARAGEHGRGFAVVAGEVRRLAERTKGATEEIAVTVRNIQSETRETLDVMSQSSDAVASGISETANARSSLDMIIRASRDVEHQINMIATAATEQTAASSEIAESASQISVLAIRSSQTAEEAAAASQSLSQLANELDGVIRQFHLPAA